MEGPTFIQANYQTIQVSIAALAAAIVVFGWFFTAWKQRKLQRKQLAITLLSNHRFEKHWTDSMSKVFRIVRNNHDFDWAKIADEAYNPHKTISDDDHEIHEAVRCVLNYFEFVAIAVLNKAADEDIIKWSYESFYLDLDDHLKPYINEGRKVKKEPALLINLTNLADRWRKETNGATPT